MILFQREPFDRCSHGSVPMLKLIQEQSHLLGENCVHTLVSSITEIIPYTQIKVPKEIEKIFLK